MVTSMGRKHRTENFALTMTVDTKECLRALKRDFGIPMNEFINRAIQEKLNRLSDADRRGIELAKEVKNLD